MKNNGQRNEKERESGERSGVKEVNMAAINLSLFIPEFFFFFGLFLMRVNISKGFFLNMRVGVRARRERKF